MGKLVSVLAAASLLGAGLTTVAQAAPVGGYEALYSAVITACSLPAGTVDDCETAINAYSGALVSDEVDIDEANQSFTEARAEVFELNGSNEVFQKEIDDLFELLLPNSGAIPVPASQA